VQPVKNRAAERELAVERIQLLVHFLIPKVSGCFDCAVAWLVGVKSARLLLKGLAYADAGPTVFLLQSPSDLKK
jgi:hypothetical protein